MIQDKRCPHIKVNQFDLENWIVERSIHGWLGQCPPVVLSAPADITKRWKVLAGKAKAVASMQFSQRKIELAKQIERDRADLIREAEERGNARH